MSERVSDILKQAFERGERGFIGKFTIEARHAKPGVDIRKSVSELRAVKEAMVRKIRDTMSMVDWNDKIEVDNFCTDINIKLRDVKRQFLKAYDRTTLDGQAKWREFADWFDNLRNKTKDEILKEISNPSPIEEDEEDEDEETVIKKPAATVPVIEEPEEEQRAPSIEEPPAQVVEVNTAESEESDVEKDEDEEEEEVIKKPKSAVNVTATKSGKTEVHRDKVEKNISAITEIALRRGGKTFDQKFAIKKVEFLNKELQKVKKNIVDYISKNIHDVNWKDPQSIENFCSEIDRIIESNEKRFIGAFDKGGKVGHEEWKEFTAWLLGLRNKTKEQIIAEVNTSEVEEMISDQIAPLPVADTTESSESTGTEQTTETSESENTEPENSSLNPEDPFSGIEKLSTEIGLPSSLVEGLHMYTEALRTGDEAGAAEYLPELLKMIARIEIARKEAEKLWEEEGNNAVLKIQSLEDTIIATGDSLREAEESSVSFKQRLDSALAVIVELRRQVSDREANVLKVQQDLEDLRSKKSQVVEIKKEEVDELAQLSEAQRELETKERELNSIVGSLEDQSLEIASWAAELEQQAHEEFSRRHALAETAAEHNEIRAQEARLKEFIARKENIRSEIDAELRAYQRDKDETVNKLQALRRIKELLASPASVKPVRERKESISFDLPDIDQVLEDLRKTKIESPVVKKQTPEVIIELKDLPYTVEFTEQDRERVEQLEQLLLSYKGQTEEQIKQTLSVTSDMDTTNDYFNQLVHSLSDGTFLSNLQKALVVFGAFRKSDGEFLYARAGELAVALLKSKIVLGRLGEATSQVVRTLVQMDMFAKVHTGCATASRTKTKKGADKKTNFGSYFDLTPLGEAASQVWTPKLLEQGTFTKDQLTTIYKWKLKLLESKNVS